MQPSLYGVVPDRGWIVVLLVNFMPPTFSVPGFLAWPMVIAAAIAVFGTSSEATLSLLDQNLGAAGTATIKAGMAAPVIRMPSTPVVPPEAARAKVAALLSGRDYASASAAVAPATSGPARMTASSSLVVRSQPKKASAAVGSIAKGTTVEVKSKQGGCLLIESDQGETGWVFGKYLAAPTGDIDT